MSDNIYISGKSSYNRITISSRETNNNLNTQNNNAKYYSDKALESANNAKQSAEEAKQSAQVAQDSASSILNNQGFIAVSQNLEPINTVANSIDDVSFVADNAEKIEQIVEDLNNLGDTTNINIVAGNIENVNTTANNINSVNEVADSINSVNEIAYNLTEVLNSKIYSENAKESETRAFNYADNASISSDLAQQWATSSSKVENTDYSSKYYANQAKSSATTATNQATIATNKANEAINTVSNTLNKTQITNCILEIPQNIKLELVNGVLTLKAGSKLIFPQIGNVGTFRETVTTTDAVLNSSIDIGKYLIFDAGGAGGDSLRYCPINRAFSNVTEPTEPASNDTWYDLTNNVIRAYQNGAWIGARSFPIAIVTVTENNVTIDQVFNGFGFIGSTIWVDKGVKGLIPNGRNSDGTLNNIEYITSKVSVFNLTNDDGEYILRVNDNNSLNAFKITNYFVSDNEPFEARTSWGIWYSPKDNLFRADGGSWSPRSFVIGGSFSVVNSKVSSLNSKQPFRAVDYNDIKINNPYFFGQYIWSEFEPNNLSWLKSSGQWNSGGAYLDFYNWALNNANAGKTGFKLSTASYTDYDFVVNTTNRTFRLPIKTKGKMGDAVVGNGTALGLTGAFGTDTVRAFGSFDIDSNNYIVGTFSADQYNGDVATGVAVSNIYTGTNANRFNVVGVSPDPTNSGLELDTTGLSLYFYVGETTKDLGLINVSQLASNIADKVEVVEAYSNGSSWYRVYSADQTGKRWCEQGGFVSSVTASSGTNITLLKPFENANYTVLGGVSAVDTTATSRLNVYDLTNSGFKIKWSTSNHDDATWWEAKGYIS